MTTNNSGSLSNGMRILAIAVGVIISLLSAWGGFQQAWNIRQDKELLDHAVKIASAEKQMEVHLEWIRSHIAAIEREMASMRNAGSGMLRDRDR